MTLPKKMIIRDLTVNEVSTVDVPAQPHARAVIMKRDGATPILKNASEVAQGQAQPLYKAAEYGDAMMARAGEIAVEKGCTPGQALLDHSGTDPVLIELACAERVAEVAFRKARTDRVYEASGKWS